MKNKGPEHNDYNWIWWSAVAIIATAAITIAIVGATTGNWPWNRGGVENNSRPEDTTGVVTPGDTTVPEETTLPEETQNATKPEAETTEPTVPETTEVTQPTAPVVKPTDPTRPTDPSKPTEPEETEPEETEPKETEPTTKPTEPEEDEGGGEKPQPGDIDVPIGPRP